MAQPTGRSGFEPAPDAATRRALLDITRITANLAQQLATKMEWKGVWVGGEGYDFNDVVRDDGWTMTCKNEEGCTDKPAPYPTGDPFFAYEGLDPTTSDTQSQILFGTRYTFQQGGYLSGYRIWTVAGSVYTVYSVQDPDGFNQIAQLLTFTGGGGWTEFGIASELVLPGTVVELIAVVSELAPTPVVWNGEWNYQTPNNAGTPGAGNISHANKLLSSLRVNKTDDNGGSRGTELLALNPGDRIQGPNINWSIQSVSDQGSYVDFTVAPTSQDTPDGVFNFGFETVTATPITYLEDVGYWPTSPYAGAVQGLLGTTADNIALDNNAYGTDILFQAATVSDEWEVVASP